MLQVQQGLQLFHFDALAVLLKVDSCAHEVGQFDAVFVERIFLVSQLKPESREFSQVISFKIKRNMISNTLRFRRFIWKFIKVHSVVWWIWLYFLSLDHFLVPNYHVLIAVEIATWKHVRDWPLSFSWEHDYVIQALELRLVYSIEKNYISWVGARAPCYYNSPFYQHICKSPG